MAAPTFPAASDAPSAREEGRQPAERFDRIRYEDLSDEHSWLRIDKGSFGNVYKGEYLGIEVAIKEVLPSTEYDVEKYMAREITLMQQARHPNVVQYLGLCLAPPVPSPPKDDSDGSDDSDNEGAKPAAGASKRVLIISEFLPRGNLRQYILDRTLPFPWRLRISFATDIARALAYLHARNTMHRDLKGENLLVSDNERLKACDFGLARVAHAAVNGSGNDDADARKPSDMYTYCGTDGYMSPEILLGLPFDIRTDIYSLGILYIEIASRKLASTTTFARRPPNYHLSREEVLSSVSSVCPRSFVDLALECCDANPDRRPDCKAILRRLRSIEHEVQELEARGLGDEDAHTRGGGGELASHNVGSISFAGAVKRGSIKQQQRQQQQQRRPAAPRLPSFEGAINLQRGSTFAPALAPSTARVDSSPEALIDSESTTNASEVTAEEGDEEAEALLALAQVHVLIEPPSTFTDEQEYSTRVIRPSQLRAPYGDLGRTSGSRLPMLASSFVPLSEEVGTATIIAAPKVDLLSVPRSTPSLISHTTTVSVAEAVVDFRGVDQDEDVFHSAFQEQPLAAPPENGTLTTSVTANPHRFSLIKPSLQRLFGSFASPASSSPRHASTGKCAHCTKHFGLMKAYLACDDCGLASHIKCSDLLPPTCAASPVPTPASTPDIPRSPVKPTRPAPLPPTIV